MIDTCPAGHPYDERNTYVRRNGTRVCRTCRREAMRVEKHSRKRGNGEGTISAKPRADGLWVARYTMVVDGRMRRPVLYAKTRAEAARKLRAALQARDVGQRLAPTRETVADYLRKWHEGTQPQLRGRSWARQGEHVRLHLEPTIGRIGLAKLRPEDVQRAYSQLIARGLSPATVRRAHAVLHRALGQGVRWRQLAVNVAGLVDPPRVPHHEMQAFSAEQTKQFLEAAHGDRYEALFVLAVTTGMRQGELLALRWKDVNVDAGYVHVTGTLGRLPDVDGSAYAIEEPKTPRSRRQVQLTPMGREALATHRLAQLEERVAAANVWQDRGLVFANHTGGYVDRGDVNERFHQLLARAGLPRIRFHDLRHTAATLMLSRGVHPKVAADMLGHSTIAVTLDLYSHVTPSMQQQAVAALDDLLR